MKTVGLSLIVAVMTAMMVALPGCSKIYIIEWTENSGTGSQETDDSGDGTQDDESGLGTNLVAFHASVESLNMTKSMSPISAATRVLVFAYHGSTDNATSTSAVARGTYIAQQAGTLTGDSGYKNIGKTCERGRLLVVEP